MSSFLQKLKSGGVAIDNNAPPDNSGMVTRRIEKRFANEPASALGLKLGNDAEVLSVEPGSAAARANIPVGFMIFDVNNEFIETNNQFEMAAERNLNLLVKLQSTASMSELIAKILREEEHNSTEEARKKLQLDELASTTPRYNFLASGHPLFRRYTNRLRGRREAAALLRQREREAEERIQRENRARIQKEIEAAQAQARLAEERAKQEEERRRAAQTAPPPPLQTGYDEQGSTGFIPVFEDKSTFGKPDSPVKTETEEKQEPEKVPSPKTQPVQAPPTAAETQSAEEAQPPAVSTAELLALLGKPIDLPSTVNETPVPPTVVTPTAAPSATRDDDVLPSILGDAKDVRYVILPSEQYTLQNGEKIIASLKSRSGPLPAPPPGKPPKISREAREAMKKLAEGRQEDESVSEDDTPEASIEADTPAKKTARTDSRRSRDEDHNRDSRGGRHHHHHRDSRGGRDRSRDRSSRHDHHSTRDRSHRDRSRDYERRRDYDRDRDRSRHDDHRSDRHHRSSRSNRSSRR